MTVNIRQLATTAADFETEFQRVLHWSAETDHAIEERVAAILDDVRVRGDAAVLDYTQRFDGLAAPSVAALEITRANCRPPCRPSRQSTAMPWKPPRACARLHQRQLDACGRSWSYRDADGTLLGQKVTPIDRLGMYVPGGKAAYPSSVLMGAVPAKVAGVGEIIMVVPTPKGERNAMVLAAAAIAGVDRVFTLGGAQAVAALAYGTATVPAVDKITGPGNAYVASAKRRVFGKVGIDMIAARRDPVLAEARHRPTVGDGLFSQAEHDDLAEHLLCPMRPTAAVKEANGRLLPGCRAGGDPRLSRGRGALIHTARWKKPATQQPHRARAPGSESQPHRWGRCSSFRAIFLGAFTSESLGDYCAGPNHVLPTSGTSRFSSPLGVYDFQKRSSLIEVSEAGAQTLGVIAAELAYGEGLQAHARAAEMRLKR